MVSSSSTASASSRTSSASIALAAVSMMLAGIHIFEMSGPESPAVVKIPDLSSPYLKPPARTLLRSTVFGA